MALTPDDIVNYEFKQAMRGYAIPQVDDLLDRLADQVERSEREIDDLRQRLRDTEARLGSTLETESTLKRTLVTAQQAAERALEDARIQADELRAAAEREVNDQLAAARKEAEEVTRRAHEEAQQVTAAARAEAEELTGRARTEAHELTSQAQAEAEELTSRARAEADELTREAREEYDQLVVHAQEAARAEVQSARDERVALESRLNELREMEARHRSILRRHLETHLSTIDQFDEELPGEADIEVLDPVAPAAAHSLQVRVREDGSQAPSMADEDDSGEAYEGYATGDETPVDEQRWPDEPQVTDAAAPAQSGDVHAAGSESEAEQAESEKEPAPAPFVAPRADVAGPASGYEGGDEGLFDHDDIDMEEEVAVASPWEHAPDASSDAEPAGSDESSDPPSPWVAQTSLPPPDPSEREDDGGDGEDTAPETHPYDQAREDDPYGHYDRFRDYRTDER